MYQSLKPLVAIVGRPNVGKSTLFNRLAGERHAIVSGVSGTTRDRVTTEAVWAETPFILVDTGGLDAFPQTDLWEKVRSQIDVAIDEADVVIVVVDAHAGVTSSDRDVADILRASGRPLVVAANKADNEERDLEAVDFHELGLGEPIPISAYHNRGMDDLMEQVVALFPDQQPDFTPDADIKLAIVGRTNVGKSMLLNSIVGQERAIVSEIPGTTRDPIDTLVRDEDGTILLIDTAGIRRRGSIDRGIERYSVLRAIRAIDRADVAVLVMDASELATAQDSHISNYILGAYKGIVLAVNKWDLAGELDITNEEAMRSVAQRFNFASFAPKCFISALNGTGTKELLKSVREVHVEWSKGLPRYGLRRTILSAVAQHPPPTTGRHALKVYSVAQDQTSPPSFTFYVNRANMVHFSYQRYLENALRKAYGFEGSPLRIRFRSRGNHWQNT